MNPVLRTRPDLVFLGGLESIFQVRHIPHRTLTCNAQKSGEFFFGGSEQFG